MIITKTPLRLSFVGGGSDMKAFYVKKDGMVLCSAIDKFVYAIVKERFDDMIYINYSEKECADHVDKIQHDLVREAMKMAGIEDADIFVALTQGDNRNVLAAQIAKHIFNVPRAVCRIYDPLRQELYSTLGLEAISPTTTFTQLLKEKLES